jgi:hypothetical protein
MNSIRLDSSTIWKTKTTWMNELSAGLSIGRTPRIGLRWHELRAPCYNGSASTPRPRVLFASQELPTAHCRK